MQVPPPQQGREPTHHPPLAPCSTEVDEAADQGGIDVVATADIVGLDRLPAYIGRRVGDKGAAIAIPPACN